MYQQTPKTVSKYWRLYKKEKESGEEHSDLHSKRKGNCGRIGVDITALVEALQQVPLNNRTTIRSVAAALNITKSTLWDNLKKLGLRSCSRFLKPYLTDEGKAARLAWALRWVRSGPGGEHKLHHFFDFVHLDEKCVLHLQAGSAVLPLRGRGRSHSEGPAQEPRDQGHVPRSNSTAALRLQPQPPVRRQNRHLPLHGAAPCSA
ncbi:unnamed protein product [Pylaiella littoralis]